MDIYNFLDYAPMALRIQTKSQGLRPFNLRKIQLRFNHHLENDFPDGIIRSISLKPRQAGWSTFISGKNIHGTCTRYGYRGLVMADKMARTSAVHSIYTTYINNLPLPLKPMIAKMNESEVLFDNPDPYKRKTRPGLGSGFLTETAQDPNAGKSSSRQWAHLSEYAFYPYASEIDQSVQNSIGLHKGTAIFKESTANGMGGDGESFYEQWMASERGDYEYKPFFVAWYEVDDYQMEVPRGFILNKDEIELIKRCPGITNANLVWRRRKIKETRTDNNSALTPEELFKQDFPSYPEEAFLSTGRPVFDMEKLKSDVNSIRTNPPGEIKIKITQPGLLMYPNCLKVFQVPMSGKKYFIGADVAEGVEGGDASHAKILDENLIEVAFFHGHLDPDHFGKVLVELAKIYNNAFLVPEINNMGHTTLQAIKETGYLKVYMRLVEDEIPALKQTPKMGWRTTSANKQKMLNGLIAAYRDGDIKLRDIETFKEMLRIVREDNGGVELNGKDRVVATCLALIGASQSFESATVYDPNQKERLIYETKDPYREILLKKEAV